MLRVFPELGARISRSFFLRNKYYRFCMFLLAERIVPVILTAPSEGGVPRREFS